MAMSAMGVCALGRGLVGKMHRVEGCVWMGQSLGAFAASEVVFLCETALAPPRAAVALDSRLQYP